MRKIYSPSLYLKIIFSAFTVMTGMYSAKAFDPKPGAFGDVYVVISSTSARLSQVFEQIEKQTSYSFVYDENDINLSKEIKLSKGQQRLKDVLE